MIKANMMARHFMVILAFLVLPVMLLGQEEKVDRTVHSARFGIARGIVLSKNFPILLSGPVFEVSSGYKVNDRFAIGLGLGMNRLENERFYPVFIKFSGYRHLEANTPYYTTSLGYSYGTSLASSEVAGHSFKGGLYFNPGLGYRIKLTNKSHFVFHLSYMLQKASSISLNVNTNQEHSDVLSFDLAILKIGVDF